MSPEERMEVVHGDITTLSVDAIVNAASEDLLGGGGVDGAIHRAAGPRLLEYNRTLGGCATGAAKSAPAFDLQAQGVKWIIHTVGPVWGTDPNADGSEKLGYRLEDNLLSRCYQSCLELADELEVRTLAFPSISTGVYGFPKERAAPIAVGHVRQFFRRARHLEGVAFVCYGDEDARIYEGLLANTIVTIGGTRRSLTQVPK